MPGPMSGASIRSLKSGPISPLIEKWKLFKNANPELYGGSLLKNLVAKAPHVPFLCFPWMAFACFLAYYKYNLNKEEGFRKPYKVKGCKLMLVTFVIIRDNILSALRKVLIKVPLSSLQTFYHVIRPDDPAVKDIQREFYSRNEPIDDHSKMSFASRA